MKKAVGDLVFWLNVRFGDACWEWTAAIDHGRGQGYGHFRGVRAHRYAFEWAHGRKIAAGLVIDHLCHNRRCVRPDHLEEVTLGENTRRGVASRGLDKRCKRGHAQNAANVYFVKGRRYCRPCAGVRMRKVRLRVKRAELEQRLALT